MTASNNSPWRVGTWGDGYYVADADGTIICESLTRENAERIVHAVNEIANVIAANRILLARAERTEEAEAELAALREALDQRADADGHSPLSARVRPHSEAAPWVIEAIRALEAEIARLRVKPQP